MTMYPIQDTNTTFTHFVLRAKGISNGRDGHKGEEIELSYCLVRGMTDNGQPAWATRSGGSLISFKTYDEAAKTLERHQGGSGWDFDMIKGSGVVRERIETHITQIVEFEV